MVSKSNKIYFAAAVLWTIIATSAAASQSSILAISHEKWMADHGREYESKQEKAERFEIFKTNVQLIESFNREEGHSYKLGVNKFADLTNEEFLEKYGGGTSFMPSSNHQSNSSFIYANVKTQHLPRSLDWRRRKAVTPVQNQGSCGCCWAFAAVAAIEGIVSIRSGKLTTPLSEQHVLDCNYAYETCKGGIAAHAMEFVQQSGGLASDRDYPYQAIQRPCINEKPSSLSVKITGFSYVPLNDEAALLKAVAHQPVSVSIDPRLFQFYHSGVLRGECGTNPIHAVTAVGYGEQNGVKFWLLKNSWGPEWGDGGYVKLERDVAAKEGMCGIAMYPVFPIA